MIVSQHVDLGSADGSTDRNRRSGEAGLDVDDMNGCKRGVLGGPITVEKRAGWMRFYEALGMPHRQHVPAHQQFPQATQRGQLFINHGLK